MKICFACKIKKMDFQFGRDRNSGDGLEYQCKKCKSLRRAPKYNKKLELLNKGLKECTECRRIKSLSEFYKGATNVNQGYRSKCKICTNKKSKEYITKHKSKVSLYQKEYRKNKKDDLKKYRKQWLAKNPNYMSEYYKNNKSYFLAKNSERRSFELQATPSWLTEHMKEEIELCYYLREGTDYHVDHIVPLRGKNVCGLHVPWNLQLIYWKENQRKYNKLIEEFL